MRKMKDSGIEWIGEIPEEWECIPIKTLFHENRNKNINGSVQNALQFKYGTIIRKQNFDANDDDYVADTIRNYNIVDYGTIMINGLNLNYDFVSQRVAMVKEPGIITSAYIALNVNNFNQLLPEYANYLFKSYDYCMAFHNMGEGVRKILNYRELKRYFFVFPPYELQQKIVSCCDSKCTEIDGLVSEIEMQITTLELYKRSVITEAVTKGLDLTVPMKDSGIEWIGEIPKKWNPIRLKYIANYNTTTLTENTNADYEFDYIDIGSVTYGKGIEQFQSMKFRDAPSRARRVVKPHDVIVSTVRTYLKAIAYVPEYDKPVVVSTGFLTLTAKPIILPKFLQYAVESEPFVSGIEANSVGISYPAINTSEAVKVTIILPPLSEQQYITDYIDTKCSEIDSAISLKKQQIETLNDYKKSLIYEYVTGKKEIPA